jgi:pimeloyl-ACP methyl ester carboxylesterase
MCAEIATNDATTDDAFYGMPQQIQRSRFPEIPAESDAIATCGQPWTADTRLKKIIRNSLRGVTVPFVAVESSPLARRTSEIHYREFGTGTPLLFLHGGWGYHIYPINQQLHALKDYRVLIPDRSGYGLSTSPAEFGVDFHLRAAEETFGFLDALGIRGALVWGHSDGAVIAAWMGLMAPERCHGLILEAFHYFRRKIASRTFFEAMASEPESFGARVSAVLAREHGESYWRELLHSEGSTWLEIAKMADVGSEDLFDGRLRELSVPAAFLHGAHDPRTDPGELAALRHALPSSAEIRMIEAGEHCPHHESKTATEFTHELMQALSRFEQVDRRCGPYSLAPSTERRK